MSIVSRTHNWKRIALWALVVLVAMGLLLVVLEKTNVIDLFHSAPSSSKGPSKQQLQEEAKTNSDSKQTYLDTVYGDKGQDDTTSGQQTNNPSGTSNTASIPSLTANKSGDSVVIIAKMQSVPGGTCDLTITRGTTIVHKTADAIYQPEFSSCAGFSVPVSEVGTGSWNITLEVTTTNGAKASKQIKYEVN